MSILISHFRNITRTRRKTGACLECQRRLDAVFKLRETLRSKQKILRCQSNSINLSTSCAEPEIVVKIEDDEDYKDPLICLEGDDQENCREQVFISHLKGDESQQTLSPEKTQTKKDQCTTQEETINVKEEDIDDSNNSSLSALNDNSVEDETSDEEDEDNDLDLEDEMNQNVHDYLEVKVEEKADESKETPQKEDLLKKALSKDFGLSEDGVK